MFEKIEGVVEDSPCIQQQEEPPTNCKIMKKI